MKIWALMLGLAFATPVAAQGMHFDLGRHGDDWGERSHRMDRDYGEREQVHRHHEEFERHRGRDYHRHNPCLEWDGETWERVC